MTAGRLIQPGDYIRRKPYTAIGVKRLFCHHCGTRKAETQAKVDDPVDGSKYLAHFALCCDCALENVNIQRAFFRFPPLVLTDD